MKCSKCGNDMLLKEGKYGLFWGCSKFPKCNSTKRHDKILENNGIEINDFVTYIIAGENDNKYTYQIIKDDIEYVPIMKSPLTKYMSYKQKLGNLSNPILGTISSDTPIGKALLGKHINDVVKVMLPNEIIELKIFDVTKNH